MCVERGGRACFRVSLSKFRPSIYIKDMDIRESMRAPTWHRWANNLFPFRLLFASFSFCAFFSPLWCWFPIFVLNRLCNITRLVTRLGVDGRSPTRVFQCRSRSHGPNALQLPNRICRFETQVPSWPPYRPPRKKCHSTPPPFFVRSSHYFYFWLSRKFRSHGDAIRW